MSADLATMPALKPIQADVILTGCEGCGAVVVFEPEFIAAHARACPGKVEADRDDRMGP